MELTAWHWGILGLVLVVAEVFLPGAYVLWPGIAALITALIVWIVPGLDWQMAALLFGVLTVVALILGRKLYGRLRQSKSTAPNLNDRQKQMVGQIHTLDQPIIGGRGRIRLGDGTWSIQGPDLPAGTRIKIIQVDGNLLIIDKAE